MHAELLLLLFNAMVEPSGALIEWYHPAIPGNNDWLANVYSHVNHALNSSAARIVYEALAVRSRSDVQRLVKLTCRTLGTNGGLGDYVVGPTVSNCGAFSQVFALECTG